MGLLGNPLARDVGLRVGPIIFETLVKHYFDKHKKEGKAKDGQAQELKDLELLYHEAFTIIKVGSVQSPLFCSSLTELVFHECIHSVSSIYALMFPLINFRCRHTIEELQSFSNTRTPSSPWMHVVRTLVPMSSCEEAAKFLIIAFGGEDAARSIVGGVKWWQVRGVNG